MAQAAGGGGGRGSGGGGGGSGDRAPHRAAGEGPVPRRSMTEVIARLKGEIQHLERAAAEEAERVAESRARMDVFLAMQAAASLFKRTMTARLCDPHGAGGAGGAAGGGEPGGGGGAGGAGGACGDPGGGEPGGGGGAHAAGAAAIVEGLGAAAEGEGGREADDEAHLSTELLTRLLRRRIATVIAHYEPESAPPPAGAVSAAEAAPPAAGGCTGAASAEDAAASAAAAGGAAGEPAAPAEEGAAAVAAAGAGPEQQPGGPLGSHDSSLTAACPAAWPAAAGAPCGGGASRESSATGATPAGADADAPAGSGSGGGGNVSRDSSFSGSAGGGAPASALGRAGSVQSAASGAAAAGSPEGPAAAGSPEPAPAGGPEAPAAPGSPEAALASLGLGDGGAPGRLLVPHTELPGRVQPDAAIRDIVGVMRFSKLSRAEFVSWWYAMVQRLAAFTARQGASKGGISDASVLEDLHAVVYVTVGLVMFNTEWYWELISTNMATNVVKPAPEEVWDRVVLCLELSPEQEALYAGLHHFWNLTYGSAQRKRAELAALALRDPDDTELQAEVAAQLSSILVKIRISLMPVLIVTTTAIMTPYQLVRLTMADVPLNPVPARKMIRSLSANAECCVQSWPFIPSCSMIMDAVERRRVARAAAARRPAPQGPPPMAHGALISMMSRPPLPPPPAPPRRPQQQAPGPQPPQQQR